ncbi:hypothetical protein FOXG_22618 [Fusarium oxysporum f. sp. lycopersici 4287]|uniref:NACHT domain-containing protein n=1 Tax=Fusarium oxysporum f. sp. lycopersici (strain 4287 / CBS 123668 / FGSC 9935 / NRRL 34936) TaxID=426428 RepID=A0A0J9WAP9_FUSO4|nr:hypothetical protein FOXG_22618 [Fusarium oxysporum f. sp. lycopersici 4287]KAJ9414572.1 hypothetical protein QL093DRAFT_2122701 [Fusarium oxysporum]KNB19635.1 hypothetical protein FOXG_22618 [Fusarium oxysporum f. sp. lycopersici 4287]
MAELATTALVGNILQFLEVGIKLSATARRAYKSIDGCIKEDKDLLTDTGRLHSLISSIQTNRSHTQGNGQAAVDDSVVQAAKACDEYASELTTLLETMSIRPGVTRTSESLRVSPRRILKNGDIHDLEAKMELGLVFESLSSEQCLGLRFCFFIDGLDEYTAGRQRYTGTFEELLEPLRILARSDSIKICVSSRPWNAFDEEFKNLGYKIQLEGLTGEDIRNYVKEELGADPNFQRLSRTDSRCSMISNNIVERAQGVFLWVILVVNYLRGGLRNNDDYSDLLQRLNDLPDDLEEYFKYMLQTIEDVY